MIRKKRFLVVTLVTISLIIVPAIVFVTYNLNKGEIQDELEKGEFTIDHLDILSAEASTLKLKIRLNISDPPSSLSGVRINSVQLTLFNDSEFITEFITILPNEAIMKSQELNVDVEVTDLTSNLDAFFTQISQFTNFTVQFQAKIGFTYLEIFNDEINFRNDLDFEFNRQGMDFQLDKIDFVSKDVYLMSTQFTFFNPFSTTFLISGDLRILLENQDFAAATISEPFMIFPDFTPGSLNLTTAGTPIETMTWILESSELPFKMESNLIIQLKDFVFHASPNFEISEPNSPIDISIEEINDLNVDIFSGTIDASLSLLLQNDSPATFQIQQVFIEFATMDQIPVANYTWFPNEPLLIPNKSLTRIENLVLNLTGITLTNMLAIFADEALSIPRAIVQIPFFDEFLVFEFSIPQIEF